MPSNYWAKPPLPRDQLLLIPTTLDEALPKEHPVRSFDLILQYMDWSAWETRYCLTKGQPPIHPRVLASLILYGLQQGLRSSHQLEAACSNRMDMMWLVAKRTIDHSTICKFRKQFGDLIKDLTANVVRIALRMHYADLSLVGMDGTQVQANSSRHRTATAATLEKQLAQAREQISLMLQEADAADAAEDVRHGGTRRTRRRQLADAQSHRQRLEDALRIAQEKEASRKTKTQTENEARADRNPEAQTGDTIENETTGEPDAKADAKAETKSKAKVKVPVADPDAAISPNKHGGFAPNYTPMITVEGRGGFIVDTHVLQETNEGSQTVAAIDRITQQFDQTPDACLADSAHGSGPTLQALAERGVTAYIPLQDRGPQDNPAVRPDPTQPVPEAQRADLPRTKKKGVYTCWAFVYDAQSDRHWCPMGQPLAYIGDREQRRRNSSVMRRAYRATACETCPLRAHCISDGSKYRTVYRDEYEALREAMDVRMGSPPGQETYRHRLWIAETPFAHLKSATGLRQFLLRGLANVAIEWDWACCAYNLGRLMRHLGAWTLKAIEAALQGAFLAFYLAVYVVRHAPDLSGSRPAAFWRPIAPEPENWPGHQPWRGVPSWPMWAAA